MQEGYETTDYEPMWQEGKVAIWEDGMWKLPYMISDTSLGFEFGMFPPPVISNDTLSYLPEAKFTEKGPNKPGVQASFTFLKKSMEGKSAAVKEACVEFVKFMTTSENMSAVVLEKRGAVLGSTSDCAVPPELADWMSQQFPIYPDTTGWLTANGSDYRQQGNKLLEQWLLGKVNEKQFAEQLNTLSQKDADSIIKDSKLDTSGWTINEK
jgi:ABC-type glycerol-3-phosphate transport system substrate-binding protein